MYRPGRRCHRHRRDEKLAGGDEGRGSGSRVEWSPLALASPPRGWAGVRVVTRGRPFLLPRPPQPQGCPLPVEPPSLAASNSVRPGPDARSVHHRPALTPPRDAGGGAPRRRLLRAPEGAGAQTPRSGQWIAERGPSGATARDARPDAVGSPPLPPLPLEVTPLPAADARFEEGGEGRGATPPPGPFCTGGGPGPPTLRKRPAPPASLRDSRGQGRHPYVVVHRRYTGHLRAVGLRAPLGRGRPRTAYTETRAPTHPVRGWVHRMYPWTPAPTFSAEEEGDQREGGRTCKTRTRQRKK